MDEGRKVWVQSLVRRDIMVVTSSVSKSLMSARAVLQRTEAILLVRLCFVGVLKLFRVC
jgi:hypothetical protein